jgi:hypothetical protein
MPSRRRRRPPWARLNDQALLDLRLCDLGLRLEQSPLRHPVARLHRELAGRGLRFRPHCWLSEEWFSPDGVPGIALPFYLAHPRLEKLEARQMFEVEGGTDAWCMQLLRHEAGHAIDTAFRLHRRRRWQQLFGRHDRPYPRHYTPNPKSRNYVLHLEWWYAQSHPCEDFAETFAVWLRPQSSWRRDYNGWGARRKLEYVDELMRSLAGRTPPVRSRRQVEPITRNRKTLREHYGEKRAHYGIDIPEMYDAELRRLFPQAPAAGRRRRSAGAFLRKLRPEICRICARGTGEHPYAIAQIVQEMVHRCRKLRLYLTRPEQETLTDIAIFVAVQALKSLHASQYRVAL